MSAEHDGSEFLENLEHDLQWLLEYHSLPASAEVLRDLLGEEELDGRKLYQLRCQARLAIVEIGASASHADFRNHRDVILDALVRGWLRI